ncbi:hypothetical protein [Methylobacterium nodulans]|uniref:Uncharacterized protein n=1 Tax=Methylobacterium nodulans (strain LMG 21967 / CNCM I-2342 / ORS 2060) TaxID=460265 RepID=B8IQY4_METNO|nr:hypothetical protein [Methylobacterium nodulans]ACL56686.1 conserved hypothetical protein [Methylobacterium nodulans ORS 2060]
MWRLLTGGIKAILSIAALAVAAQWAARPEASKTPALASAMRDPATTGAIVARKKPASPDQRGLQQLMSENVGGAR